MSAVTLEKSLHLLGASISSFILRSVEGRQRFQYTSAYLKGEKFILVLLTEQFCLIPRSSDAGDAWARDSSESRASSLRTQHVAKPLYKSSVLKVQTFAVMQDKNTFSSVCNLGLKVSRADSGRNGKSITSSLSVPLCTVGN